MDRLDKIRKAIEFEKNKVYSLINSKHPDIELQTILTRLFYLQKLETAELRNLGQLN